MSEAAAYSNVDSDSRGKLLRFENFRSFVGCTIYNTVCRDSEHEHYHDVTEDVRFAAPLYVIVFRQIFP